MRVAEIIPRSSDGVIALATILVCASEPAFAQSPGERRASCVSQDTRAVMHRATEMKVTLNHREGHNLDHSPQFGERLDIEAVLREDSPD
jgi:hypothetical protein